MKGATQTIPVVMAVIIAVSILVLGFNILGRKSVFERFKICFNEREKVVEFIKL